MLGSLITVNHPIGRDHHTFVGTLACQLSTTQGESQQGLKSAFAVAKSEGVVAVGYLDIQTKTVGAFCFGTEALTRIECPYIVQGKQVTRLKGQRCALDARGF